MKPQNPFATSLRTHTLGSLTELDSGTMVEVCGWVHKRRDHGGLIFIDLRDKFGITQIVFDPGVDATSHTAAERLRSEYCVHVTGKVRPRGPGLENPKLKTGKIEIECHSLTLISASETPPFQIAEEETVGEDLALTYRYLDLRKPKLAQKIALRNALAWEVRSYFHARAFEEIETPILTKSTPEGSRDYIVPSRIYPGNFYALPQSPQLYKQLCMIAGFDRYFQIARCFRDEDLRADRQPEFTQIDVEMSFVDESDIEDVACGLMVHLCKRFLNYDMDLPARHMSYGTAMEKYGSGRPDLGLDLSFTRIDSLARRTEFAPFQKGVVKCFVVPAHVEFSRSEIDGCADFVRVFGLEGVAWTRVTTEGLTGGIAKFFPPEMHAELIETVNAKAGDVILYGAGKEQVVNQSLDHLRRHIGAAKKLYSENDLAFVWITGFPLLELDPETGGFASVHHPFTSPLYEDLELLEIDPLKVRARAYDLVLNGIELGGGSIRIHDNAMQQKIFNLLGLTPEIAARKFGFFLRALKYGTPIHGGFAFGLDRIAMLLTKSASIREVIPFPKTAKAADLMLDAPSHVDEKQLKELSLRLEKGLHNFGNVG